VRLVERRIGLLFALFLALFAVIAFRAVWLGTVSAGPLSERASTQQVENIVVSARRGTIRDRRGLELAVSEDSTTVYANPFQITQPVRTANELAPLLGRSADQLLKLLADRDKGFVYLRRKLDPALGERVKQLRLKGIGTLTEPKRTYPQGALASQLLGWVGTDNYGLSGIEHARDETLKGQDARRRLVKDALGEPVSIQEAQREKPGEDISLTIDTALQERVEAVLNETGRAYEAKGATAVLLDPRTGAVLSLANWPSVDANDPGAGDDYSRQNRAATASYEPGSTFKAFTVAAALQERVVTPETPFGLPPTIQVADREIGESHPRGPVSLTTAQILAQSSNVGSVKIGLGLGARRFSRWVHRFGFGRVTGIGLPGEQQGIVPTYAQYSGSSIANLPIGQGLAVTPLQMAAAYTAIANGGVVREPYVFAGDRKPGRRVISRHSAEATAKMLEGVLAPGGTAAEATIQGYTLAGKTGTSEKPDGTGGYSKTRFIASFIGFAPARNPRVLAVVMVDEPKGDIYGGSVAAPAFQRMMEFALPYLRIPPD
jgi:cell division protein FtsI/penicillin-binding protein 2